MESEKSALPHILHREPHSLRQWMNGIVLVLLPLLACAVVVYGLRVLLPVLGVALGAVVVETAANRIRYRRLQWRHNCALASALLLALLLPPATPLWLALIAGAAAMLLGREVFGGLGRNFIHEAAIGKLAVLLFWGPVLERAYLQPFWWRDGGWLTSWRLPAGETAVAVSNLQTLFYNAGRYLTEVISGEKAELALGMPENIVRSADSFRLIASVPIGQFWLADAGGLIGEASIAAILLAYLMLSRRRVFSWEIPLAGLLSFALMSLVMALWLPLAGGNFLYFFAIGELWLMLTLFGTDSVTSPLVRRGKLAAGLLFGITAALATAYIEPRFDPILLALVCMNCAVPLLNLWTMPRGRYGKS